MNIRQFFSRRAGGAHRASFFGLEIFKFIGPGFLVTVGFIDPGNWGANLAAGAEYGYSLLWMVSLSTLMLIVLQHNAAHLGIVSGLCLSEAAMLHLPKRVSLPVLFSAVGASVATSFAELLGAALALRMLFGVPLPVGGLLTALVVIILLVTNSYRRVEYWIMGCISLIGLSFVYELTLISTDWVAAGRGWVTPSFPEGSILVIMSVLGAVVMPHNLFLHSEVIQSRQWQREDEAVIKRQLRYEFLDTLLSMLVGWGINSAMILLAAYTFFSQGTVVTELEQAKEMLAPLLGANAGTIFAVALLFAGFASTITSAMAGGSIVAGIFGEPYDIRDNHTRLGVIFPLVAATIGVGLIAEPLQGLIVSQALLSVQLPFTMAMQVWLTSSPVVMGSYANLSGTKYLLMGLTGIVTILNILLFLSIVGLY